MTQELEKKQKRVEQTMQLRREKEESRTKTGKGGEAAASGSQNLEFTRGLNARGESVTSELITRAWAENLI